MGLFIYKILKHCENKTNVVYHVKTQEWIYQCVIVYNLDLEIQKKKLKSDFTDSSFVFILEFSRVLKINIQIENKVYTCIINIWTLYTDTALNEHRFPQPKSEACT